LTHDWYPATISASSGLSRSLGRPIEPSDAVAPGRNPVAVISYHDWQRKFASDPGVLGASVVVNGTPFTVIGVAPAAFFGESVQADPPDLWMPLTLQPQVMLIPSLLDPHGMYWLHIIGRRKADVSWKQAQEWLNLRFRQYLTEQQGTHLGADDTRTISQMYVDLVPGGRGVSRLRVEYAQPLEILMGVVILVLLIACANLATFYSPGRRRARKKYRPGLRSAPAARGSSASCSLRLCCCPASAAPWDCCAYWGTRALVRVVVAGSDNIALKSGPDTQVLAFTLVASLLTGLLFGLAPALRVSRVSLAPGLKAGSRTVTGDATHAGRFPLPKALVAVQIALSLLLLAGAGLFVRTLRNLRDQDFGFDRESVLLVNIDARIAGYAPGQIGGLYQRIHDTLSGLPGVRSATLSSIPPMNGGAGRMNCHPRDTHHSPMRTC
jgi:hypothetical protein